MTAILYMWSAMLSGPLMSLFTHPVRLVVCERARASKHREAREEPPRTDLDALISHDSSEPTVPSSSLLWSENQWPVSAWVPLLPPPSCCPPRRDPEAGQVLPHVTNSRCYVETR